MCASETCAEHSTSLRKMFYLGGHRFLNVHHRFRSARRAFNRKADWDPAPQRRTGHEIYASVLERKQYLCEGGVEESDADLVKKHGIKSVSIFFCLPYWAVSENVSPKCFDF